MPCLSGRRVPVKIEKSIRLFYSKSLNKATVRDIQQELLGQLKNYGYFLAKVDSIRRIFQKDSAFVKLVFFVNPGLKFHFGKIHLIMEDTLKNEFEGPVHEIFQHYEGKPYTAVLQRQMFSQLVGLFENAGYPLCTVRTMDFAVDSLSPDNRTVNLFLEIVPGRLVRINDLQISSKTHIEVDYLRRLFHFKPREKYQEKKVQRYLRLLKREDFVKTVEQPELFMGRDSIFYLLLKFEEASATALDGVVGYVPPTGNNPGEKGYFTGQFNVGLRNIFGTGRRLDVFWQKPNRFSEEFRVKYREPFVFGLPFHSGVELHRLVRDTTYIEWKYSANLGFPLSENLEGVFRFYNRQVYPDSLASKIQRLPQTRAIHTELGFRWDKRDDLFNPTRGFLISTFFDYGKQRNIGPDFLIEEDSLSIDTRVIRFTMDVGSYFQTWKNQVLSFEGHTVLIGYQGQDVRLPDMFWFGGATTLRGYREQQFFADRVGWLNLEYRFLFGPQSRFFIFSDLGYYTRRIPQKNDGFLLAYGLGLRFPGPLGIMQVDYGLARGLPFREGKLHIRLINEF